uniref:Uncharacterized protein n=1 Tax=Arundo donax TaxID=35708 RepID=A0A0A9A257_ARUDO
MLRAASTSTCRPVPLHIFHAKIILQKLCTRARGRES